MTALVCPFEEHWQHDDATSRRLAEAGGDADEFRRHVGEQNAFLFNGALADQALAEPIVSSQLPALVRVAR